MFDKNELFVLPFDHRGSFMEEMFDIVGKPTKDEARRISYFKGIIYDGYRIAIENGMVPKENGAILADEQFGDWILTDAKKRGYKICVCAEKSGQEEFDFEYGKKFREHIDKYGPSFVKALIRYNPEGDRDLNERQIARLKVLSGFCNDKGYGFMLEPLVPPTEKQLKEVSGDKEAYDREMRPKLMELMIEEVQYGGVEPNIWKIEGLEEKEDYEMLVEQVKAQGRKADIIILGRHASDEQVRRWLETGAKVDGVVGFAVGRTIFWNPLIEYKNGEITSVEASKKIAENFTDCYKVFKGK